MDMRKVVGHNFARLRQKAGLTQDEAADRSGFAQSYIAWLERGRRNPTAITMYLLAQAVGAMPADLLAPIDDQDRQDG